MSFPDGPNHYPKSCVQFVHFDRWKVRRMFSYLRQKEEILQVEADRGGVEGHLSTAKLHEVESVLMWMVSNLAGN